MKGKRFAVIGLGHFGAYALRVLYDAGCEVIAIDLDAEAVKEAAEFSERAVVADATDVQALESLGVADVDVAIVSLGERMDVITLAALHLKELGVPNIAVKSLSEEHGRILKAIGVNEIVHPEKDAATRLARRLVRQDVLEYLPLMPGYSIIEIKAPEEFVGRSLRELALRNRLQVQLIGIQRGGLHGELKIVPRAEDVIEEGDLMILLGAERDLDRIREIDLHGKHG
ncbi:MAG: TrkA family potassium uptake protein [Bryobacterales bacterium]|nr:TrkA family potassium uptake protein [Bryobacterales bacterium]